MSNTITQAAGRPMVAPAAGTASSTAQTRKRPWRDNIEAITMALVMAVMLKYFVIEAYKIPTGSMQPTLLGNDDTGLYDRILVDKASYHYRDPERFEVAVFRYPLDRSKSFIKRIVGMPDEHFRIKNGDLWTRKSETEEWRVLRRPRAVQKATWKRLSSAGAWLVEAASRGWEVEGQEIRAAGEGSARFPREQSSVRDHYTDGYPGEMGDKIRREPDNSGDEDVGDLRVEGSIEARADCKAVEIEFSEGSLRHLIVLPGPAAAAESVIELRSSSSDGSSTPSLLRGTQPFRLPAGRRVSFWAQNMDDLLELEISGAEELFMELRESPDQVGSRVRLTTLGGGATFRKLELYRDIFYVPNRGGRTSWIIPPDSYFMMGDNTQDSADSREWAFLRYRVPGADGPLVLRGNNRSGENPLRFGEQIFLRDEWGERHVFQRTQAVDLGLEDSPFVPRELIAGRALLVFWPFSFKLGVYRLKWVQ